MRSTVTAGHAYVLAVAGCAGVLAGAAGAHAHQAFSHAAKPASCSDSGVMERASASSVDSGEELLWEDDSKYNDALGWATGTWYQRSGALSLIRIAPDHVTAVNDVEWRDWSKNNSTLGTWQQKNGIDHIYFNKTRLDKAPFNTRDARRAVAVHELGHALGLCHKKENVLSVMWTNQPRRTPLQAPTDVDKANYERLWG
ncbi:matrixin family metalloprotease [Streptomyces sp. NPDC079020]|uniref:matrixin family metalloprotease n=1 Tax=Streptomyces sp. NPDC079020 TaxID=3365722 RepID=UPI0037CD311D